MSRDIISELSEMMSHEKRKAFDAGVIASIDMVIQLCEMSGGRLNAKQLQDFKHYTNDQLNERENNDRRQDGEGVAGQETPTEDTPAIQSGWRVSDTDGLQFFGPIASNQSDGEEAPADEGQASQAVTQAESS